DFDDRQGAGRLNRRRLALALVLVLLLFALVLLGLGLVVCEGLDPGLGLDGQITAGDQRADATAGLAGDDDVAAVEGAALDQNRGDYAAPAIDPRLEHDPGRAALGGCTELEDLGQHAEPLEEILHARAGLGRDLHDRDLAAVGLGQHAALHELALDLGDVGVGEIALVDGDEDRDVGRL